MLAGDVKVSVQSFLATPWRDYVHHPLVEPFLQFVGLFGRGDALVQVGQYLSQAALRVCSLPTNRFRLPVSLASRVSTQGNLQFPRSLTALPYGSLHNGATPRRLPSPDWRTPCDSSAAMYTIGRVDCIDRAGPYIIHVALNRHSLRLPGTRSGWTRSGLTARRLVRANRGERGRTV